jgi:hypothetical protein
VTNTRSNSKFWDSIYADNDDPAEINPSISWNTDINYSLLRCITFWTSV